MRRAFLILLGILSGGISVNLGELEAGSHN